MFKKAILLASATLALAIVGSASIPTPPCAPCLADAGLTH
jgi:hypothetical protein